MIDVVGYSAGEMPAPKRSEPPRRIRIAKPAPVARRRPLRGQALRRRHRRRLRRHLPRRPRDAARRRQYKAAGRPTMARVRAARGRRPHQRRPLGGRVRGRDARAAGSSRSRPGPTAGRPGTTSCGARSTADQRGPRRRALRGRRAARARAASAPRATRQGLDRARARRARRRRRADAARSSTPRSARSCFARDGARRSERHGATHAREADPARGRPRQGPASAPGTSCSRAPGAASRRVEERVPEHRRPRLRRALPAADPPDRRQEPQGPQQRARRRPGRPRLAVRDRRRRGRPRRRPPRARHRCEDVRDLCATAHEHGMDVALDIALNASRRPPVADRAPRVVPAAPRRHAQVRREPAQALPGHLQLQLGHDGLARRSGRRWLRRRPALGRRAAIKCLPRRQPAHEAVRRSGSG